MLRIGLALAACLAAITPAQARHHHRHHHHHQHHRHVVADGRPAAWCGWFMRHHVGIDPGPAYNLARNWAHFGSPSPGPCVGCIVVWLHHVGRLVGQTAEGTWIVLSGNDGHRVRQRPRSLRGAIAFRRY